MPSRTGWTVAGAGSGMVGADACPACPDRSMRVTPHRPHAAAMAAPVAAARCGAIAAGVAATGANHRMITFCASGIIQSVHHS